MKTLFLLGLPVAVALALAYIAYRYLGLHLLLDKQDSDNGGRLVWQDMGPTPLGERGFTPQGLAWVEGRLVFANTWKNAKSRVYEIDPSTMQIERWFDMPPEAVHTSGLAWGGEYLWAVDYASNRAYQIDLEVSFANGTAQVEGSFDTTLEGSSGCCLLRHKGDLCLVISDFMRTRRTIFVRVADGLRRGTAAGAVAFEYRNEGFSQGLAFVDGHLFETENKFGTDVVNKLSLERLYECADSRQASVAQYSAPFKGVEDLAWDGTFLWTSDERSFRFYKAALE